jgi:uncharacterized protein (TIGR02145 family)
MAIPENDNQLWKGFDGHGLYAKRSERDVDGNVIDTTYAKKADVPALDDTLSTSTTTAVTPRAVKAAVDEVDVIPALPQSPSSLYSETAGSISWGDWEVEEVDVPYATVEIGGREYKIVQIGNQWWMAENLDWKFSGCVIGSTDTSTTDPRGNYYNNDETSYGINGNKYGLLYNWPAAVIVNTMAPTGWRVPLVNDVNALIAFLGSQPGTQLKSKTGWDNDGNGTDIYGYAGVPTGYRQTSFMGINSATAFWTLTEIGQYDAYARTLTSSYTGIGGELGTNKGFRFSIRLVKDIL